MAWTECQAETLVTSLIIRDALGAAAADDAAPVEVVDIMLIGSLSAHLKEKC